MPGWWERSQPGRLGLIKAEGRGVDVRVEVQLGEQDVIRWTLELAAEFDPDVTEKEVRKAAQDYIAEIGLAGYRETMRDGLEQLTRDILWELIWEARTANPTDVGVSLLPTSVRCSRTDGFCPIKMDNRDCRRCQFFLG